jgi:hypothetical protein
MNRLAALCDKTVSLLGIISSAISEFVDERITYISILRIHYDDEIEKHVFNSAAKYGSAVFMVLKVQNRGSFDDIPCR